MTAVIKQRAHELIEALPDDATWQDLMYALGLRADVPPRSLRLIFRRLVGRRAGSQGVVRRQRSAEPDTGNPLRTRQ